MILGIGCDVIELKRIEKAVAGDGFCQRVYTEAEIAYCRSRGVQATASFAVGFAAKEAVLKALGTGLRGGALTEIEVVHDALGKPEISLKGYFLRLAQSKGVVNIQLSLSHSRENGIAYVVMEGEK